MRNWTREFLGWLCRGRIYATRSFGRDESRPYNHFYFKKVLFLLACLLFCVPQQGYGAPRSRFLPPLPPPTLQVTIQSPQAGALITDSSFVVSGTVNLNCPTTVLVNGVAATLTDLQFVSSPIPLKQGTNTIEAVGYANDGTGRSGTASITVSCDSVPPVITLSQAYHLSVTNNPSVTIKGNIGESGTITLNGAPFKASDETYAFEASRRLKEGANRLILLATDRAGNETRMVVIMTLDTRAPEVSFPGITDGKWGNQADYVVSGVVNESATLTCNGQTQSVHGSGGFSFPVRLQEGNNVVTVWAKDIAGNASFYSVRLNLDTKPPVLTCAGISDGALTNQSSVAIRGSLDEVGTLTLNGSSVAIGLDNRFSAMAYLVEGTNTVTLAAADRAGNTVARTFNVTLDTTPPGILWNGPANDSWVEQDKVTITGVLNEKATLTCNGTAVVVGADLRFAVDLHLAEGSNVFVIEATDAAGNTAREILRYMRDAALESGTGPSDSPKQGDDSQSKTWSESNPLRWTPTAQQYGARKLKVEAKNADDKIAVQEVEIFVLRRPREPKELLGGKP